MAASLLGVDEVDLEERPARLQKNSSLIEMRGEEELPGGSLATRYRFSHAWYQSLLYGDLVAKRPGAQGNSIAAAPQQMSRSLKE